MIKEIIPIIFLFSGELSLPSFPFEGTVHECFEYGNKMRIEYATYSKGKQYGAPDFRFDGIVQGWYLKNGTGTWQGFICK
tara:strand:- start:60 stop:299 length:240 start_codon:yes stop_codon:yes gene_type:complete